MTDNPYKRPKVEMRRHNSYLRNTDVSKRDIVQLRESIKIIDNKIAILDEKINLLNEKTDVILAKVRQTDNTVSRMNDFMVSHIDALNSKLDNIVLILESRLTSSIPSDIDNPIHNCRNTDDYKYIYGNRYYS